MHQKWRDVILAIQNKKFQKNNYEKIRIGSLLQDDLMKNYQRKKTSIKTERIMKNYFLSEPFAHIYFTHRELECIKLLIAGYSNREVSDILGLSERTVEFYIRNMRDKTGTLSKSALLELMKITQFTEKKNKTPQSRIYSVNKSIKKSIVHGNH